MSPPLACRAHPATPAERDPPGTRATWRAPSPPTWCDRLPAALWHVAPQAPPSVGPLGWAFGDLGAAAGAGLRALLAGTPLAGPAARAGARAATALAAARGFNATPPGHALRTALGAALLLASRALMAAARRELEAHGTHPRHGKPVTALVTSGPFSRTRNPLYNAAAGIGAAAGLLLNSAIFVPLVGLWVAYVRLYVVPKEERALAAWWPGPYAAYARRVSRWGVPLPLI